MNSSECSNNDYLLNVDPSTPKFACKKFHKTILNIRRSETHEQEKIDEYLEFPRKSTRRSLINNAVSKATRGGGIPTCSSLTLSFGKKQRRNDRPRTRWSSMEPDGASWTIVDRSVEIDLQVGAPVGAVNDRRIDTRFAYGARKGINCNFVVKRASNEKFEWISTIPTGNSGCKAELNCRSTFVTSLTSPLLRLSPKATRLYNWIDDNCETISLL